MKRYALLLGLCIVASFSNAQNTFPSSGNVGIGTLSPSTVLQIEGGGRNGIKLTGSLDGTPSTKYINIWQGSGAGAIDAIGTGLFYLGYDQPTDVLFGGSNANGTWQASGKVGIGTTSPQSPLDVTGSMQLRNYQNVRGAGSVISFSSYGAIGEHPGSSIRNYLINAAGPQYSVSKLILSSYDGGNKDEMTLYNGNVGINMSDPQYSLDVNGQLHAKSVLVNTNGFPDFVFDKDYKLKSLKSVERFIKINHHLSELPSQDEALSKGVDLGEVNKKLLQKIEELTLYLIEKDKQLATQNTRLKRIEKKIKKL